MGISLFDQLIPIIILRFHIVKRINTMTTQTIYSLVLALIVASATSLFSQVYLGKYIPNVYLLSSHSHELPTPRQVGRQVGIEGPSMPITWQKLISARNVRITGTVEQLSALCTSMTPSQVHMPNRWIGSILIGRYLPISSYSQIGNQIFLRLVETRKPIKTSRYLSTWHGIMVDAAMAKPWFGI